MYSINLSTFDVICNLLGRLYRVEVFYNLRMQYSCFKYLDVKNLFYFIGQNVAHGDGDNLTASKSMNMFNFHLQIKKKAIKTFYVLEIIYPTYNVC